MLWNKILALVGQYYAVSTSDETDVWGHQRLTYIQMSEDILVCFGYEEWWSPLKLLFRQLGELVGVVEKITLNLP